MVVAQADVEEEGEVVVAPVEVNMVNAGVTVIAQIGVLSVVGGATAENRATLIVEAQEEAWVALMVSCSLKCQRLTDSTI